jgi:hypothetical protein
MPLLNRFWLSLLSYFEIYIFNSKKIRYLVFKFLTLSEQQIFLFCKYLKLGCLGLGKNHLKLFS